MKAIRKDLIFRLLMLNMALVIFGYAMAVMTSKATVEPMRIVKYLVLLVSFLAMLRIDYGLFRMIGIHIRSLLFLSLTFLLSSVFTEDPVESLGSVLTFLLPFTYIAYTVGYLCTRYSIKDTLDAILNGINWIYFIPVISFFITGGGFYNTNIYYLTNENDGTAFVSNHYGWSGTLFLVTGIDLLRNVRLPPWRRWLTAVTCCTSMYMVLISGNRTSWLSLIFVACIFIVRYNRLTFVQKALLLLIPLGLVLLLLKDPKSSLYSRARKTETQRKKGETRVKIGNTMFTHFRENPSRFVTGIGMFNKPGVKSLIGSTGYHNSYFEVLFGAGFLVAAFFAYLMITVPLWNYLRFFSRRYIFLAPLMIIPYFESNLTGGQFLFFPWTTMVLLMGFSVSFARQKETIRKIVEKAVEKKIAQQT